MKSKRIVAALSKVAMSAEQREDVLNRILAEADIRRAARNKEQTMETNQTTVKTHANKCRERCRVRVLRWAAAAAVLAILAALFAIPGVSKAIRSFFAGSFRLSGYMSVAPDEREKNEDIEAAIQSPALFEQSSRVLLLSETDEYGELNAWRIKNGYGAFDPAEWEWMRGIEPEIREVYYDGAQLIVSAFFKTDPLPFMACCYAELQNTQDIWVDAYTDSAVIRSADGSYEQPLVCIATGTEPQADYQNGDGSVNVEAMRADGGVYLLSEFQLPGGQPLPDGVYTVTVMQRVIDYHIDCMARVASVGCIEQTFAFDTAQANANRQEIDLAVLELAGTVWLSVEESGQDGVRFQTYRRDLSGVTVQPHAVRMPMGVTVSLEYTFPDSWSEAERNALMYGGIGNDTGLRFIIEVNGETLGELSTMNGSHDGLIPLTQSELDGAGSIALYPVIRYSTRISAEDGVWLDLTEPRTFSGSGSFSFDTEEAQQPLPDLTIVIPLN